MNNQSEKPIEELLRGIPQDHRICIPFQWAEDGRETGHHYMPVGRHVHQAADKITALREKLKECHENGQRLLAVADSYKEVNAALRLDAERYRWLREKIENQNLTIAVADSWSLRSWSGDNSDASIDAAMKEEERK
jgi:hypothetical protein